MMTEFSDKEKKKVNEQFSQFENGNFSDKDKDTVLNNMDDILKKSKTGALASLFDDISTMCDMVKCWASKEYKGIPVKTIGMVILTLVYVFSPVDIVPDFIPVVGLLDDVAMVTLCLGSVKSDLNDFKQWKKSKNK